LAQDALIHIFNIIYILLQKKRFCHQQRGLVEEGGLDDNAGDTVRVDVGSGTSILQVAIALSRDMTRNTNGGATVSDTRGEVADVSGLMTTSETKIVVLSVNCDVFRVLEAEFFDSGLDGFETARLPHFFGAVIAVATSSVPLALKGFRMEGDLNTPLFSDANKKITSHPEVIAHGNTLAGSDLELPLRRHHLSVNTTDVDAGIEAGAVVSFN
jgi:hypothetical protein